MLNYASGSPSFSNTAYNLPIMSSHILVKFYQKTIFSDISTTEYTGELRSKGDTIIFRQQPEFMVREGGGVGSTIRHDTGQFSSITKRIGRSLYFSLGVDPLMADRTPDWGALEGMLIQSAARQMQEHIDKRILSEMYLYAHARNCGANAGLITRSYNMGAPGAPLSLSSSNVLEKLTHVGGVMAEQNIDIATEDVFLVVPPKFKVLLQNSELKAAYFSGLGMTTYLNGRLPNKFADLTLFPTNRCPMVWDAVAGKWCFYLTFGVKRATAFVTANEYTRRIDNDPNSWLYYIQQRSIWDFFVLYPQLLGRMYVTL